MPSVTYIPTTAEWNNLYSDQAARIAAQGNMNNPAKAAAAGSTNAVTAAGNPNLNNLSNPDWIKAMSEMISQINIDAQQKANASRIPNASGLEKQSSGNIADALAGKLPSDVINQIAQTSAERGVSTGNPMGASTNADLLKAIGLNSLQLQNTGQSWLDQALGRNPSGPIANTQALVTTPAQAEDLALKRQAQELDYLKFLQSLAASKQTNPTGYGGGRGGGTPSGGGSFAPATNWSSGVNVSTPGVPNNTPNYGTMAGSDWTPGTYTDTMNPLYGYTQTGGLPNSVPAQDLTWENSGWNDLLPSTPDVSMNLYGDNTGYTGGNDYGYGDLSPEELMYLYSGGY